MKVAILSNSKGGVFIVTMQWAKGLVRKGCDVNFSLTQPKEAKYLLSTASLHLNYLNTSGSITLIGLKKFLV